MEVVMNELDEGRGDDLRAKYGLKPGEASARLSNRAQKLANQRKGQTPKRKGIYQNLAKKATERERGPFQRGDTRTGMTQDDRDRRREADAYESDLYGEKKSTYGPGSLPKGPKLYRQTVRGVTTGDDPMKVLQSAAQQREHYNLYDIILSHLLDEGYAETPDAAEAIMVNMSEEWRDSILG
jgi:hypothetical protein